MKTILTVVGSLILLITPVLQAQGSGSQEDAKKIIEKIQKEMEEINRLLNQASRSSSSSSSSSTAQKAGGQSKDQSSRSKLQKSLESSDAVIEGIDTLIRMAGKQGKQGSQGKGKKPQGEQGKDQKQGGQPRPENREGQTPDFVNQGGEHGKKPDMKDGDPDSNKKDPKTGKNIKKEDTRKHPTEKVDKNAESGSWGNLPPYLQKLFRTGGKPEVPSRYRDFEKEFHRNADKKKKKN